MGKNNTKDIVRVGIYARVSTVDQQTLSMQTKALKEYAKLRKWQVVMEFEEIGSGTSKRPQRELLLKAARQRKIDNILVWKLDRWGRSLTDVFGTLDELNKLNVGFVSLTEALDLNTITGTAMAGLLTVFAKFERDILKERVKAGIAHARAQGKPHGRPKTAALKQDDIKDLFQQGYSKAKIAKQLKIGRASVIRLLKDVSTNNHLEKIQAKQTKNKPSKEITRNKTTKEITVFQDKSTCKVMDEEYYTKLLAKYKKNRELLSNFNLDMFAIDRVPEDVMKQTATKLGVTYYGNGCIGSDNHAELNIIYDYCVLYHYENGKCLLANYLEQHPKELEGKHKAVLNALLKSYFTILRVDQTLPSGAVRVFDYLKNDYHILMDEALNHTVRAGRHLVASILDMKHYTMTSGGAIIFDTDNYKGKEIMNIFNKYLAKVKCKKATTEDLIDCVTKIFNHTIVSRLLHTQYVNDFKSPNYGMPAPSFNSLFGLPSVLPNGGFILDLDPPSRRRRRSTKRKSTRKTPRRNLRKNIFDKLWR